MLVLILIAPMGTTIGLLTTMTAFARPTWQNSKPLWTWQMVSFNSTREYTTFTNSCIALSTVFLHGVI